MKKILSVLVFSIFLVSFASASINFETQPNAIYNLGDNANVHIKIIPEPTFNDVVSVFLLCGSNEVEIYKEFLSLTEETIKSINAPLISSLIGNLTGGCNFEVKAGSSVEAVSSDFEISKVVKLEFINWGTSFNPGENISIIASAIKENGFSLNGFYEMLIDVGGEGDGRFFSGIVNEGEVNVLFEVPFDFSAGDHKINLSVYDLNSEGKVLNSGRKVSFLNIRQVPRSLEIILEEKSILPGNPIEGEVILHDQTGENIPGEEVYITIKDKDDEVISNILTKTGETFLHETDKITPPSIFYISAFSGEIINNAEVEILVNKKIESEIINSTLILTNVGNVFYEDILVVEIGEDNVSIPVSLDVAESERYAISAPDGNYDVSVLGLKKNVPLSGNAIQVQKIGGYDFTSIIWIVALVILALGAYLIFRKGVPRKIFTKKAGPVIAMKNTDSVKEFSEVKENAFLPSKKVELSLSITGSKQPATIGCISLKNYNEISSGKGGVKETLERIFNFIEEHKGIVYVNNGYIFFILAPSLTKTFKNQKEGVLIAQKISEVLKDHNKRFNQKMDYGISLNYGEVITKIEKDKIKFMSLGTFMTSGKKLSTHSQGEVLISEKLKANLEGDVKGSLVSVGNLKAYKFEGIVDRNNHSTFIKGFLARQERDKAKELSKEKK